MKNSQDVKSRQNNEKQNVKQNYYQNKSHELSKKSLHIKERFVLKSIIPIGTFYKAYKGIDLQSRKYVTIYLKPTSKEKKFSKNIKEELRQKIAPPLKWFGTQKIDKNLFDIEVHGRYGPSLDDVMNTYRKKISQKTFFLLAYNILKLIDKIDHSGYVNRSLSPKVIICGESYLKNDLYLINTFDLERKNQQSLLIPNFRYCSVGTHLKLKTSSKDTLQSMCYMLMDFYLRGSLFPFLINQTEKTYFQAKSTLKPQGIPVGFLQFFEYVRYLNHEQQIKYSEWKLKFKKFLSEEQLHKPYQWLQLKTKSDESILKNANKALMAQQKNNLFSQQAGKKQILQQEQLQLEQDKEELDEGELCQQLNKKTFQAGSLFFNKY